MLGPGLIEHRLRRLGGAEIGPDLGKLRPHVAQHLRRLGHARPSDADHPPTGPADGERNALPDAGIGTGHHHRAAGETEGREVGHRSSSIATFSTSV